MRKWLDGDMEIGKRGKGSLTSPKTSTISAQLLLEKRKKEMIKKQHFFYYYYYEKSFNV